MKQTGKAQPVIEIGQAVGFAPAVEETAYHLYDASVYSRCKRRLDALLDRS
ncbi:hypothetical protein KAU45_04115 [bacterium]|nr:hypothetical protein [bacterium]